MIDEILSFSCFYYLNNRFEAKVLKIYRELWSLIILVNFNSYDDLKEKRGREKSFKNFDTTDSSFLLRSWIRSKFLHNPMELSSETKQFQTKELWNDADSY